MRESAGKMAQANWTINNGELSLKGYNLFRADRKSGSGGGVLLYLHESLPAILCVSLMDFNIDDSLWCTVTLRGNERLLIGIVYRSPSSSEENNTVQTSQKYTHTHVYTSASTRDFSHLVHENPSHVRSYSLYLFSIRELENNIQ